MYNSGGGAAHNEGGPSLALITGAAGELGAALLNRLANDRDRFCVGICRSGEVTRAFNQRADIPANAIMWAADVGDLQKLALMARGNFNVASAAAREITIIHAVGPFKYEGYLTREEAARHDVDETMMRLHAEAMEVMAEGIMTGIRQSLYSQDRPIQVRLCTFGSVSEPYEVPLWHSFNQAKKRVQGFMRSMVDQFRDVRGVNCSALYVRTSSINTASKRSEYKEITPEKTAMWLDPEDVADFTMDGLGTLGPNEYRCVDIVNPIPGFEPRGYYTDVQGLHERWTAHCGPS